MERERERESRIKWLNGCFYQWVFHEIKFPFFPYTWMIFFFNVPWYCLLHRIYIFVISRLFFLFLFCSGKKTCKNTPQHWGWNCLQSGDKFSPKFIVFDCRTILLLVQFNCSFSTFFVFSTSIKSFIKFHLWVFFQFMTKEFVMTIWKNMEQG